MDPIKKIEGLEAERELLEKTLAEPGISEGDKNRFTNRIIGIDNNITALTAMEPAMLSTRWWRAGAATVIYGMATTGGVYASARLLNFPQMHAKYFSFGFFWLHVVIDEQRRRRWTPGR